ncbi:G-type lectin S-receptor-like serine/threonine-protein kinase SD2-5 [Triticum urartu]|uniref:non-specific serine/threonine protein kinase n=1 Tax=Triticum urartu TaxID=4572 RepID=M7ZWN5_TRIUA|nr:G-type lectin S-receptor-like serine/threonine-protein kinase SD2-5 [Triticum urartu]
MGTSPLSLHHPPPLLLLRLLLLPFVTTQTILNITNRCPYTVWPAALPVGGGMRLDSGKTWTLQVPSDTRGGRVWARTGCSFDGKGNGSCQTGDCEGLLACKIDGQAPVTSAEFSLNQYNNNSFFGISLGQGFNVPMEFLPMPVKGKGGSGCRKGPHCGANITSQCPSELKAPGGCNNACTVFQEQNNGMYCCYERECEPNKYSAFFVRMCPEAISYSSDAATDTSFSCPFDTDYQVIFCPPVNLTSSPPSPPNSADLRPLYSPPSPPNSADLRPLRKGSSIGTSVSVAIAGAIGLIIVTFIFFIIRRRGTRRHHEMTDEEAEFDQLQGTPMRFTFQQLEAATKQFKDKLGEGGFGSVFEGQLGEERIAVKRLDRAGQGKERILGGEKSHRLLVYEYMPKGSLDRWIYGRHENSAPPLEWRVRCKIIADIAKGLSYLHEDCMKRIAHLDVKPQNILLDDDFNAKLSDFGLCKLIDRDMSQVVTRMRGTPGYLAPEWLTSQITEKADVYSFGVVVMEIVSGRKNLDTSLSEESIHLITLLEEKVKNNHLEDLIDKSSNDMQAHDQDVIQMMKLAMWCLQIDCKGRPKMSEVVKVLEGTMDAESNIDHNFVTTNEPNFGIAGNVNSSDPPVASDVSGPR